MIIQNCVKGIAGNVGFTKQHAFGLLQNEKGIISNWWRSMGTISPGHVAQVLTQTNLDRHLHDYANYGSNSPFISLAAGSVERVSAGNVVHSAIDTALEFATDQWSTPGALFYCWVQVGMNPSVEIQGVAEEVRNLHTYKRWSPYQLEGEVTAKIQIPSNQIERVEWWDGAHSTSQPEDRYVNPKFCPPTVISNMRELF